VKKSAPPAHRPWPDCPGDPTLSIARIGKRYAVLVIVLILVMTGTLLVFAFTEAHMRDSRRARENLDSFATVVAAQIHVYRELLRTLAARHEVQDLLVLQDQSSAFDWALQQNDYLPGSVGLALMSKDGEVYGDPYALRVGSKCLADVRKRMTGARSGAIPFHDDVPELAHFDLTARVTDPTSEPIGLLFASFSVDLMRNLLDDLVGTGERLILLNEDGVPIVEAGSLPDDSVFRSLDKTVPGTGGWRLSLDREKPALSRHYGLLAVLVLLFSTALGALVIKLSRQTTRGLLLEVENIGAGLHRIADGSFSGEFPQPHYDETRQIFSEIQRVSELLHDQKSYLTRISTIDDLTGLPNRRLFMEELQRAWNLAGRGIEVIVVVFDIDHFKVLNDTRGHAAGDVALQLLAMCLAKEKRATDMVARLGGDEFAALLVNMAEAAVCNWFDRLRHNFRDAQMQSDYLGRQAICTLSAGAVCIRRDVDTDGNQVLRRADNELYQAKAQGRDCICATRANPPGDPTQV
jgi:diguanylate cyclase (GGDEF)-like protein